MHQSSNDCKDTVGSHGSALRTGGSSLVVTASLIHERLLGLDISIVTTFDQGGVAKQVHTGRPGVLFRAAVRIKLPCCDAANV